jgi:glycosyltransferase involved in cell wall biosynthesis
MKPKLSILVLTKNEEARLPRFFASLRVFSLPLEVLIVDSGSTDKTVAIARKHGARVLRRPWKGFAATRNLAVKDCQAPWVLCLDADENPDGPLCRAIQRAVTLEPAGLWSVNRLNYFLGSPVRHGGWHPDRHLRLFPKGQAWFNGRLVHEGMEPAVKGTPVRRLEGLLHHFSYPDLSGYLARLNRYTSLQAEELYQRKGARPWAAALRLVADPPLTFLKMFVLKAGFLDGTLGLNVALLSASSTFWKYAKWWHRSWVEKGGAPGLPWPLRPGRVMPELGQAEEYR